MAKLIIAPKAGQSRSRISQRARFLGSLREQGGVGWVWGEGLCQMETDDLGRELDKLEASIFETQEDDDDAEVVDKHVKR